MKLKCEGVQKQWEKYKYIAAVVLIGIVLLLWPQRKEQITDVPDISGAQERDLAAEMEEILSAMSGVGQVKVLLTLDTDGEKYLAQDTELSYSGDTASPEDYSRRSETILADTGERDEAVVIRQGYPTYRGALVVCQGGDRAEVQLAVTRAVSALTGLAADRITVAKWQ